MKDFEYQGSQFYYSDQGQGKVIVLLHGFCEDSTIWDKLTKELNKDYRTICIDLPGHGRSAALPELSMRTMADLVKAILDKESINKCVMIGHSMGGYVAVNFAFHYEDMLSGLGFFHSTAAEETEQKKQERTRLSKVVLNNRPSFVTTLIPGLFLEKNQDKFKTEIDGLIEMARSMQPIAISQALIAMRDRPSQIELVKKIQYPVMYILGKEDIVLTFHAMLEQLKLPSKCYAYITSEASHMGFIEDDRNCNAFILSFCRVCN